MGLGILPRQQLVVTAARAYRVLAHNRVAGGSCRCHLALISFGIGDVCGSNRWTFAKRKRHHNWPMSVFAAPAAQWSRTVNRIPARTIGEVDRYSAACPVFRTWWPTRLALIHE